MNIQKITPLYQKYHLPLLIGILLLTFIARLHNLDAESLWVDEGFSYWAIRHTDVFGVLIRDVHPPLYFLSLRLWASVTDITEFALRYFSVLPSVLSVAMIYSVARELEKLRNRHQKTPIPLLASLMLALADMETSISQDVRMYTWHVLWVLVSAWGFLRFTHLFGIDRAWSRRVMIACAGWIIGSITLVYTQYVGLAFIGVQGLMALLFLRGKLRLWAMFGAILIGASFIPWGLAVVVGQTANVGTGFNVPSTLESLWNWRVNWFTQQWALTIGLALLGLFPIGLKIMFKAPPPKPKTELKLDYKDNVYLIPKNMDNVGTVSLKKYGQVNRPLFLLLWIIAPVAGAYILNFYTPILMDYRLTQITPAIALLIAYGLGHLRGNTLIFIVAVLMIYGVTTDDTAIARPPFRDIGQFVADVAQPDDLLLAHVTPSGDWQMVYYYELYLPNLERRSLRQWQLEEGGTYQTGLRDLLNAHNGVWLMHWSSDTSSFEALRDMGYIQTAKTSWAWVENSWLDLYRFDRIDDTTLAEYQNGMNIRQVRVSDDNLVEIWWSSDAVLDQNYTVSAILLDENGRLVAQDDSYPFFGQNPTSTWAEGTITYDPHHLKLVDGVSALPAGTYTVGVKVYLLTDTLTIQLTLGGDEYAVVGTVHIP